MTDTPIHPWPDPCGHKWQPLAYGPGPVYRNVPIFPGRGPAPVQREHWTYDYRPGTLPPPPFVDQKPWIKLDKKRSRDPYQKHRQKRFYAVALLDKYYEDQMEHQPPKRPKRAIQKTVQIKADSQSETVQWIDTDHVRIEHGLSLPITLQIWDNQMKPCVYAPILKMGAQTVTLGKVTVQSQTSVVVDFTGQKKPMLDQIWTLKAKHLEELSLAGQTCPSQKSLGQLAHFPRVRQRGLALVFRRATLDSLFDLISQFDDQWWHSSDESSVSKWIAQKSAYKQVTFFVKWTDDLQQVLDTIDPRMWDVKFSWDEASQLR